MSEHPYHDISDGLRAAGGALRKEIPDVYRGFGDLHKAAFQPGSLATKFKELVALGIAISDQCDGCIISHVRGAIRSGANKEEVVETIGVAIAMMGGPGTVWGPRAYEAYLEYAEPSN